MNRILTVLLFSLFSIAATAQEGHEIKVTLKPFKNQWIYLGHYYGKQMPIVDSALLNDKSEAVFKGNKKLGGGIYLVGFPDRARNFEILIDKNQHFSVIADTATLPELKFVNSPDNTEFVAYQQFMNKNGLLLDALFKQRQANPQDSVALTSAIEKLNNEISSYRNDIMTKNESSLLATLMRAMREPETPNKKLETKADSLAAYHAYKAKYWDGIYFWDERLARTPFFESRVDKYFEQLVYPAADSVIREIDNVMSFAGANDEMKKFFLLKFVNRYYNQKYMWEDAVFVHLYEKYFANKTYPWLTDKGVKMIQDRAYSLMANIFGSPAYDIELPDSTGAIKTLYKQPAKYTLLVIWDPTCGHCKEVLPKLDSAYRKSWKSLGLKLYAMAKETEGKKTDWTTFISKNKLDEWTHVYYSKEAEKARVNAGKPGYSQLFDVQSFPTLYLLDKDKRIIAKKVALEQINDILGVREKAQAGAGK